jgi:hypothetical protein
MVVAFVRSPGFSPRRIFVAVAVAVSPCHLAIGTNIPIPATTKLIDLAGLACKRFLAISMSSIANGLRRALPRE